MKFSTIILVILKREPSLFFMIQLIYVSSAVNLMSEDELLDLLAQSSQRNKRKGVTGLLLYAGGNFIQVLEGEQSDVRRSIHLFFETVAIQATLF